VKRKGGQQLRLLLENVNLAFLNRQGQTVELAFDFL
jgi:hypothetical protein